MSRLRTVTILSINLEYLVFLAAKVRAAGTKVPREAIAGTRVQPVPVALCTGLNRGVRDATKIHESTPVRAACLLLDDSEGASQGTLNTRCIFWTRRIATRCSATEARLLRVNR